MEDSSVFKYRGYIRRAKRKLFSSMRTMNHVLSSSEQYDIRKGYHHASNVLHFNDTSNKDEWQKEVYEVALAKAKETNANAVLDVGCGSGYKLVNMFADYGTTGIEVDPTYTWLKQNYPNRNWILFDDAKPETLKADVVVCSDVIEHVKDPDQLLRFIQKISFQYLIISTPEREELFGKNDFGPPANPCHFREWSAAEFKNYLSRWFIIESQYIFKTDNTVTQALVCKK